MDDDEAIRYIELPQETIYLIDKVVRQKSKAGPIGVDNSEFINIEMEEEVKEKNQYIQKLVDGYGKKNDAKRTANDDSDEEDDDNKENQHNQRLLDRLSTAAARVSTNSIAALATTNHANNQSQISAGAGASMQRSQIGERSANAYSHEEWMRRKEHELKLKGVLIKEAKRDILE